MNPAVPALALVACYAVAVVGLQLVRAPSPAARRMTGVAESDEATRVAVLGRLMEALSRRLARRTLRLLGRRRMALVRHRIDAAGRPTTLEGYAGRKGAWTVMAAGAGLALSAAGGSAVLVVAFGVLGWLMPDFALARQARSRQARIQRDLPDFLDILQVIVASGAGFRTGLARVADALGGPLAEEIMLTLRQMDLGSPRREALSELRSRNDSETLVTFVTALLQAEELGSPLADTLADIAVDLRREFQQDARRRAAQAAPRIGLLVTTLIVPGALVLIIVALYIASGVNLGELFG
ncbi:MAG: type II secretion system F family protein [Nitriliruptorales bacterium]|nr:type II secretion system F family protein [Nitriliruptorales bacterium]